MDDKIEFSCYYIHTDIFTDSAVFKRYYDMLPLFRREKVDRIKTEGGKRLSLGAGLMLMKGLREYGISKNDASGLIKTGENGKPYILSDKKIYFNLSHSGNLSLAVFSDKPVGCDVEYIKDCSLREQNLKIAKRFFNSAEYEYLNSFRDDEKNRYNEEFTKIWVLKESFIKATGKGLAMPLDSFSVLDTDESRLFKELKIDREYKAACCFLYK